MPSLVQSQFLPVALSEAWDFLSNPHNLSTITPPQLNLRISAPVAPVIYPGMIITYNITPLFNIPMTWVSEIAHVRAPYFFVDRQLAGPYRYWHHEHELSEAPGGVLMNDRISFSLPFAFLGTLAYHLAVKAQLSHIFQYRRRILEQRFWAKAQPS